MINAMKTPIFLRTVAMIFWGFASGNALIGALLAVILLLVSVLAAGRRLRLTLADEDVQRIVDISMLTFVLAVAALLASKGLPAGLLLGVSKCALKTDYAARSAATRESSKGCFQSWRENKKELEQKSEHNWHSKRLQPQWRQTSGQTLSSA